MSNSNYTVLKELMLEKIANNQSVKNAPNSKSIKVKFKNSMLALMISEHAIHLTLNHNLGLGWMVDKSARYDKDNKYLSKSYDDWMDQLVEQVIVLDALNDL